MNMNDRLEIAQFIAELKADGLWDVTEVTEMGDIFNSEIETRRCSDFEMVLIEALHDCRLRCEVPDELR